MARMRSLVGMLAACFALAACGGGGGGGSVSPGGGGGGTIVYPPGTLSIAPTSLAFSGPGAATQTFTVSSTLGSVPAPAVNATGCAPVASITTSATTLPATYTVTPLANGSCSFVTNLGNASTTIGITVGPPNGNTITGNTSSVGLYVGGTAGSVTVSDPNGTYTYDATACNGIATVAPVASPAGSQTYSITPVAAGTCQFPITSGSSSLVVAVAVNAAPSGAAALQVTPTTLTFASQSSAPQQGTLSFTGSVGQVSINENDCIGLTGKAKIAFLTFNGAAAGAPISLPAAFTVTTYGPVEGGAGTCSIVFTPQNGTAATLTVTTQSQ